MHVEEGFAIDDRNTVRDKGQVELWCSLQKPTAIAIYEVPTQHHHAMRAALQYLPNSRTRSHDLKSVANRLRQHHVFMRTTTTLRALHLAAMDFTRGRNFCASEERGRGERVCYCYIRLQLYVYLVLFEARALRHCIE